MKKTVILILAILPIVLLMIIAIAGRIVSIYQNIPVEKVEFVDRIGTAYSESDTFYINEGASRETKIRIYPELASNKRVSYSSSDESVCTVDSDGVITGVHYGMATVIARTDDGGKVALINVMVKADVPYDVTLSRRELALKLGQKSTLEWVVEAPVAVDKRVTFASSDTSVVTVDGVGNISAVGVGTAIVTVTTVSGGVTDSCTVTVVEGRPPILINLEGADGVTLVNPDDRIWLSDLAVLDLKLLTETDETIDIEKVVFSVEGNAATMADGVLTFVSSGMVTVRAVSADDPELMDEVILVYDP
jgi:hypothetical protein